MTTTENTSALVQLYADVKSYFATASPGTAVVFGFKERTMQINQGTGGANRVCFVPGRLDGAAGSLVGVDGPGERIDRTDPSNPVAIPRALFLQGKLGTLSIWASNPSDNPDDRVDEVQAEQIIEQYFEWVVRAVKRSIAGAANVEWADPKYNREPNEMRFGIELLVEFTVGTQLLDDVPNIYTATSVSVARDPSH